ncbi:MAG: hypothetical protein O8C66_15365 [Candidatus Methanoperedens sp.]|nr:hypothetical protein [Candidatus Methanoperedens sp.]MCZ7371880.1 hypothetical protein [Candidatus Methanoperedens sp.]
MHPYPVFSKRRSVTYSLDWTEYINEMKNRNLKKVAIVQEKEVPNEVKQKT